MGKTYQENKADTALVVKSLKVLENIDGGGMSEIRRTVDAVKKQLVVQNKTQEEYWKQLSDDGIVSPVEKQGLLREMENIRRSESAITTQAVSLGYTHELLRDFTDTYDELHTYLYDTLHVFDDMSVETPIGDRDVFNQKFSNYYFLENFLLLAVSAEILDQINFRVLQSLSEPGEEGDTGIYRGGLYQYTDGQWKSVTTGAYKGPRAELPGIEEGAFFIASEDFTMVDVLMVNGTDLLVNGEQLLVSHLFAKGMIYYCEDEIWKVEDDLTNWRYAAAFADVINITGRLPQIFQDAIDNLQNELNTTNASLEDEIAARQGQYTIIAGDLVEINDDITDIIDRGAAGTLNHLPQYYGPSGSDPSGAKEGDFYVYNGNDSNKSVIRRFHNGAWEWLSNPAQNYAYRNYYQMALTDILEMNKAGPGYFSELFADAFWANSAVITNLETRTIHLQSGGSIESASTQYVPESVGLKIKANGDIDANGNTHIKGKVAIGVPLAGNSDFNTYDVVIGGNTKISGKLDGATGSFSGDVTASNCVLSGFTAGDVILRRLGSMIPNGSSMAKYSQICGTGTIRLKFEAWYEENGVRNFEYKSFDADINEGQSVSVIYSYQAAAVVIVDAWTVKVGSRTVWEWDNKNNTKVYTELLYIDICTNTSNGLLAYLGDVLSTESRSPIR